MTADNAIDRARGCLKGLAVGDALGTTVEFQARGTFTPVTDMTGGGPFRLEPGQWTDDTSMALCLAESLLECDGFDAEDQMRRYCAWWNEGHLSSTGQCFDIGGTTRGALQRYEATGSPWAGSTDPGSAGNGSIMRLAPVCLYWWPDTAAAVHHAAESSRTTHGAEECLQACRLLAALICRAFTARDRHQVLAGPFDHLGLGGSLDAIARGSWRNKTRDQIRGTGYVVESLEAAIWCFARTESFPEAVLMAVNLGDDADTTAAVCGQLAGAFYGERGIPAAWRERLHLGQEIGEMAEALWGRGGQAAALQL